jgi:hypothetical protein
MRSARSYHHLHWERSRTGEDQKGLLRLLQQLRQLGDGWPLTPPARPSQHVLAALVAARLV